MAKSTKKPTTKKAVAKNPVAKKVEKVVEVVEATEVVKVETVEVKDVNTETVEEIVENVEVLDVEKKVEPNIVPNRFITKNDKKVDKMIFDLEPNFWWSRLYEYALCLEMASEGETVLDLCTGTYHPFKFALLEKTNDVYACDLADTSNKVVLEAIEKRFGTDALNSFDKKMLDDVKLSSQDIVNLNYEDNMFDKIFCISALEHLSVDVIKSGLKQIKRVLKNDGKVILTLDYPTLKPDTLISIIEEVGLKVDGEFNYDIPSDAISSTYFGETELKCYSIVLIK